MSPHGRRLPWPAFRVVPALLAAAALAGCATVGAPARQGPGQKLDPWEAWNRKVFDFNETVDAAVLVPVARAYRDTVPQVARESVDNFFGNVADAWSAANHLFQGKVESGLNMTIRVGTNTVFGVAGLLDPAGELGFERQSEDFGQTLGAWGLGTGAYIVLPIFGPSSVRDALAFPVDRLATPAIAFNDGESQASISVLQVINTRANLLGATRLLDEIALDKYSFVRDAYLARRRSLVFDGRLPEEDE